MSAHDARDPYLGLNNHIRRQAQSQIPTGYAIGKVISVKPLVVRAAGMNLDKDDLKIAQHLKNGWTEPLAGLSWPLTVEIPQAVLMGSCACSAGSGTCQIIRGAEIITGKTADTAAATHPQALMAGDEVILIPSTDGQTYYMVDKLVGVDA